jgi:hypothetical protein
MSVIVLSDGDVWSTKVIIKPNYTRRGVRSVSTQVGLVIIQYGGDGDCACVFALDGKASED